MVLFIFNDCFLELPTRGPTSYLLKLNSFPQETEANYLINLPYVNFSQRGEYYKGDICSWRPTIMVNLARLEAGFVDTKFNLPARNNLTHLGVTFEVSLFRNNYIYQTIVKTDHYDGSLEVTFSQVSSGSYVVSVKQRLSNRNCPPTKSSTFTVGGSSDTYLTIVLISVGLCICLALVVSFSIFYFKPCEAPANKTLGIVYSYDTDNHELMVKLLLKLLKDYQFQLVDLNGLDPTTNDHESWIINNVLNLEKVDRVLIVYSAGVAHKITGKNQPPLPEKKYSVDMFSLAYQHIRQLVNKGFANRFITVYFDYSEPPKHSALELPFKTFALMKEFSKFIGYLRNDKFWKFRRPAFPETEDEIASRSCNILRNQNL